MFYGDTQLLATLPTITFPNLKILECDVSFFNKINGPSLLEHLYLSASGETAQTADPTLLRGIRSFKGDSSSWRQLGRFCDVAEYVWISTFVCSSSLYLASLELKRFIMQRQTYMEDTLSASSHQIKYLRYVTMDLYPTECSLLFEKFPDLAIIDIDCDEFQGNFRYTRDAPEAGEIHIHNFDRDIRNWHGLVVDAVEEVGRKNKVNGLF
ncbi:hypothetical protein ONZ45_g17948 [Pleurotus djamor]|nr:hypothetical protein ONZ45_g17948 [Pleurotus djamor]